MSHQIIRYCPNELKAGAAGGSDLPKKLRGKKSPQGASYVPIYGRRFVKHYPITEGDMWSLFAVGLITAILFSVSGFFLNYGFDVYKDLSLGQGLSEENLFNWNFVKRACFWLSGILFGIGLLFTLFGWHKIKSIKSETKFGEEE